jgi:NAD(P)-dependent dehydrogenase (short-subunit alcohol dehydrogenase family)
LTVSSYDYAAFEDAFKKIRAEWPDSQIRVGVFNAGDNIRKPFLDIDEQDVRTSLESSVVAAFGFSREAILAFQKLAPDSEQGKKGTLILTGATAALRGNKTTSAFAASKFGLRALSQSLAKEFGPQGIHVSHVRLLSDSPFHNSSLRRPSSTAALLPTGIVTAPDRGSSPTALPRYVTIVFCQSPATD